MKINKKLISWASLTIFKVKMSFKTKESYHSKIVLTKLFLTNAKIVN